MRPPPFLLGAALLFWGWQSDFLVVGAVLATVVESAGWVKVRWEFMDEEFARIWTFCSVLMLAALVYAFTENQGPANFSNLFQNPSVSAQSSAGTASARTASALFRWMPMLFFPFVAAFVFSPRTTVPVTVFSYILQRRRRRARAGGTPLPPAREVPVEYPYFAVCLVGASVHPPENASFFWGVCVLLTGMLWSQRPRRFGFVAWLGALAAAIALGYFGQYGISQVPRYLGNLDASWLLRRFLRGGTDPARSVTALGRIGELKLSPRIVIRLETRDGAPPPEYLREASYRLFKTQTWLAGGPPDAFIGVPESPPNSGLWSLLPGRTNRNAVNIACYLEGRSTNGHAGLLPLPGGSSRLEKLPAFTVERNPGGAVLATGPGFMMFDVFFGPGATIDAPADTNLDRQVPPREEPALEGIVRELNLRGQSLERAQRTLADFFSDTNRFAYRTWQRSDRVRTPNETPLSRFLLQTRKGHCEYFATATVLLLRQAGVPARYAVGYVVHEKAGRKYVVRERDSHAWTLVWDDQRKIWEDFDTTPASWIETEADRASWWQWFSDAWSWIRYRSAQVWWGQTRLRQYVLWALVPVLVALLYQIIFRRGRRRWRRKKAGEALALVWPGLDSEFYQLETQLATRGVPRATAEPLSEWLERAAESPELAALQAPLERLLRLHYRYRFDPNGLEDREREDLRQEARACLEELTRRPQG